VKRQLRAVFALAVFWTLPWRAGAQGQLHPRWEIPGFDFSPNGVWRARGKRIAQARRALLSQRAFGQLNLALSPALGPASLSATAVTGTLRVPAILLGFSDTYAPGLHPPASYDAVLFGSAPPANQPYTIRTFYEQLSHGLFSMQGQVLGWVALSKPEVSYTGGTNCTGNPYGTSNCNGIFQSGTMSPIDSLQAGLREALAQLDAQGVDWGQFDNDGPDGVPNSGDDDGYVDMAIFIHPNVDGACGGNNNVWSHRYVLQQNGFEAPYVTKTPWTGHPGQYIKVRDYTIQSGVGGSAACDGTQIMPIGTAAHESGHGLALPDLYDIRYSSEGIGEWGLMGSGNYSDPFSPSRMEAWSLSELGWVTVVPLTAPATYAIGPAPIAESTYVVRVQGNNPRGEYFLIENREAVLADTAVINRHCRVSGSPPNCGGGLMVWHVDSEQVANNSFHVSNLVNAGAIHGVELEQADGLRNLDRNPNSDPQSNRGDAGDPYPGTRANTIFSFRTNPAATKNSDGSFVGFAIDSIHLVGPTRVASFRLRFGSLTQVEATDTAALIAVDGQTYHVFADLLDTTTQHTVSVSPTQYRADSLVRWTFQSWSDGGAISHPFTSTLAGRTITANLVRAFRLQLTAIGPGTVSANPASGTYVAEGSAVQLVAHAAAGMLFLGWSGDTTASDSVLAVTPHRPLTLAANFSGPLAVADVLRQIFTGSSNLTVWQIQYLAHLGNASDPSQVGVGDFLAWVRANHPTPPGAAKPGAAVAQRQRGAP
jgi:M6 family metalloprotease-like protein